MDRHRQVAAIGFVEQAVVLVLRRRVALTRHRYIRESSRFPGNTAGAVRP
jgi:hypothetical protein